MSGKKSSLLDKRIADFFENTTDLLTDIHARHKAGTKNASTKRKTRKAIPKKNPRIDSTKK